MRTNNPSLRRPRIRKPRSQHLHNRTVTPHCDNPTDAAPDTTNTDVDTDTIKLYTPIQAAELLAVKESWLRRKAGRRAIPCTFIGKHLRFSASDLRAITALGAQPAQTREPLS